MLAGLASDPVVASDLTFAYFAAAFGGDGRARYREFVTSQT